MVGEHAPNMLATILRLLGQPGQLTFVDDQVGHVTFTDDLATACSDDWPSTADRASTTSRTRAR